MKKALLVVTTIISFLIFCFTLDYLLVKYAKTTPFMAYRITKDNNKIYYSLFYKVYYCNDGLNGYNIRFRNITKEYSCPKSNIKERFKIVEETGKVYEESIEEFYNDGIYSCTFDVIKSDYVYIDFGNERVDIKTALEENLVTPLELIQEGLDCKVIQNVT